MSEDVYWIYTFKVKAGALNAFKAIAQELVDSTILEPGAISYQFSLSNDERIAHVLEHYADSAAIVAHVNGTFAPLADRMSEVADSAGVTVYGNPQGEARRIIDTWGAVYMTPIAGFVMRR